MTPRPAAAHASLLDAADLCVKCGLCLPHCPTYGETRHEADSPRGRIALLQGLASDAITQTTTLEAHLDGCLSCRACERVCPAKVPYGQIIDAGRALLGENRPGRLRTTRIAGALLSSRVTLSVLSGLLWLYRRSGLQALLRRLHVFGRGRLARLESLIPSLTPASVFGPTRALRSAAPPAPRETVQLFTGCVGSLLDESTLGAAETLFARIGVGVTRPRGQTCCGAIYEHGGLPLAAQRNAVRNLDAFAGGGAVVHAASGCGATLVDYAQLAPQDPRAADFVARLEDLAGALLRRWPADLRFRPLRARVAIHQPCTQRNVLGGGGRVVELLRKIPELEIVELDPAQHCCGAAGMYFVTQPQMADRLLAHKLASADLLQPDFIVSTNIGCSLHLAGGLRRRGTAAPRVLHPAVLLARQLPD
jgi:glycolate oxidase iron-sulfur subunit